MLLILTLLRITSSQTLVYSAFSDTILDDTDNWSFLNIDPATVITKCGSQEIIGGHLRFANTQAATKLLQLPPHYRMKISMTLYIIDSWDVDEYFQVYVDQVLVYKVRYSGLAGTNFLCGQETRKDSIHQISMELDHTGLSTFIYLTSTLNGDAWDESWGFKNFELFIFECPPECLTCTNKDTEADCNTWRLAHSYYTEVNFDHFVTDGWSIQDGNQNKQNCLEIPTICGKEVCGKDTILKLTLLKLPVHTQMKIKLKYLRIGSWEWADHFQTFAAGELIWESPLTSFPNYLYGICSLNSQDVFINIDMTFPHYEQNTKILIINNLDESYSNESFGVRDIQTFIKTTICGDKLVEMDEECDDGNLFPFDGCFGCMFSCVDGCSVCQNMICLGCFDGWTYLEYEFSCEKQINQKSSIITFQEEYTEPQSYPPIDNCQVSLLEVCIVCQNGFILNQLTSKCDSICNYQIVTSQEQCQYSYLSSYCYSCQIQCSDHCLQCISGICQVCENDYYLEDNYCFQVEKKNLCQAQCQICIDDVCYKCQIGQILILGKCLDICGDQIAPYSLEECVCDQNCQECVNTICYSCKNNLKLLDNECIGTCGDLVVQDSEDCDDGNDIEFDGCFNCRYSCSIGCINCEFGICLDLCLPGFYFMNNACSTICGDSIIAGSEQCEDNNTSEYDGCYLCKFSCPLNCFECIDGTCNICNFGFQLIENQCSNVCGDGTLQNGEECDDGNLDSGDGCSKTCQVEINWICNQGTDCTFVKYPQLICEFIQQKNQYQYARIKFSQEVQLLSDINFQNSIELSIIDLNETYYNITIMEVQSAQYQVILQVEYIIQVEIFTNQLKYPILTVKLTEQLYNDNLAPLVNMMDYLQLNQPNYLTDEQVQIAQAIQLVSKVSFLSIYALSIILIILGNTLSLWGMLDALQQQSYLKFINVLYPQTLIIYFQSSELISMQSLLDSIVNFSQKASLLKFPYLESYEKFQFYQVNADITEGFRSEIFLFLTLLFCYMSSLLLERVISIVEMSSPLQGFPKVVRFLQRYQRKLNKQIKKIDRSFIHSTLLACSWDLIFMAMLEISSYHDFSFYRTYVRLAITFIILIFVFALILYQMNGVLTWKRQNLDQYWFQKQAFFLLIKKILIVSVLVFYQREQILQTLLMTLINGFYLIYVINTKTTEEFEIQMKNIIMEASLTLFTASTIVNWDILQQYFDYNFIIIVSWIQMFLLVSVLISYMLFDLYDFINLIKSKIRKILEKRISKLKSNEEQQSQNKGNELQKANFQLQKSVFTRVEFVYHIQIKQ
ncbi:unnamed protein product (macronuclear) [Paramecium tetraurelia]|uniref:TNFR-Cys domain-containing protein n=1 Tax=Paramecium tetraurelia TaxID=5888 RepID=A0BXZ7_PARTE|nr:uncharacterized protein GSPATT00033267001 [Paramecium tetraurelia]CAK63414.1 unnamed protein product [Paramecium tetraurelia]|eukprot:XP_001430812.1 hypothetical protein (macronuclear) [Paramecium tetraurelia strain d4-2]